MSEADNTVLKEINEFVADCAKSILLNNIKADDIKNNIKSLNDQVNKEFVNLQKSSETQHSNEINNIVECQKSITNLLSQYADENKLLIRDLMERLSQSKDEINALVNDKSQKLDKKINDFKLDSQSQIRELSEMVSRGINNINMNIDSDHDYLVKKSKYLPWMTAGIYLTLVILTAFGVITLRHFGILKF